MNSMFKILYLYYIPLLYVCMKMKVSFSIAKLKNLQQHEVSDIKYISDLISPYVCY